MNKKLLLGTGVQALREQLTMKRIKNFMAAGGGRGRPLGQNRLPGMGELPGGANDYVDPASNRNIVTARAGNIRPDAMLPRSRTYGYSAPTPIRKKEVPGVVGGTVAAVGGIVSGVFGGKEDDLVDDLVSSGRGSGQTEVQRRLRDTLQVSPRSQAGQSEVARRNQDRQNRNRRRRTSRELSVYFTLSIAALLAAGFTVSQASKFIKKVRTNLRGRKAALDIVKLANVGDTEGAQMLLDKEFGKTGIDMNKVANAVQDVSNRELKIAARVLKREIES